jgi:hypothetical protein
MCTFTINLNGSVNDFFTHAQQQVMANNGQFDAQARTFQVPTPVGGIAGNFNIAGQQVTINVLHKPFVIGCNAIEEYVNDHLN